jgi:hypothetical protein
MPRARAGGSLSGEQGAGRDPKSDARLPLQPAHDDLRPAVALGVGEGAAR